MKHARPPIRPFPRTLRSSIAAALLGFLAAASASVGLRGDLIYFKDGGRIQAPAVAEKTGITIDLAGERYAFRAEDLEKRVPGFVPAEEWAARRKALEGKAPVQRFAEAWWALENGLIDEAVEELTKIHAAAPDHEPTRRMVAVVEKLKAPCDDPDFEPFRKALGIAVRVERGPHVVLLHQHPEAEAGERVALLERLTTAYHLLFAGSGVPLTVPRRRLVFAWFADRSDYQAFLTTHDASAFGSTRGYYHPTWNAVVAYDARSSELQRQDRTAFAKRRDELQAFRTALDRLPPDGRLRVGLAGERPRVVGRAEAKALIERLDREVRRGELLLEAERRAYDDGMAAHELVHLLAVDSGLLPRHDAFPIWLQEGLAMQFEVVRGGRWAGIGRPHDIRLLDWRKIQPAPPLEPLLRDRGFGQGYRRDPYAQAWALAYFLRARRGDSFVKFLDLLRSPQEASPSPQSHFDAFRRAFGEDLGELERDWHAFLDEAQTPLERHAPHPPTAAELKSRD
ncbi:DUF1570 domain-containing protein [Paludisphaera mucosa]|uniref:DUF1570 domain-containing protein n=1 Tax=Paludisphaera mucosa TaxID=3030827 RepID=A0ABT6F9X5_9BACT|nr:DUF1570 domain-containing protein [Paludisphaera mucosa]MDG3004402.1 DUF1570 domain-containing protein [Paludisphaera mucosa]